MAIASGDLSGRVAEYEWLEDHLDHLAFMSKVDGTTGMEITGIIKVSPDKAPGTAKEAVVHLTTRFLHLMDELDKHQVRRDRLPEVVIGQVGNGYQAQVTLTVKMDTYKSPYMAPWVDGSSNVKTWNPQTVKWEPKKAA